MGVNRWALCKRANVIAVIRSFRVEPIAFLSFLSLGLFHLVSQVGMYRVICYHVVGDDTRFNCSQLGQKHGRHHGSTVAPFWDNGTQHDGGHTHGQHRTSNWSTNDHSIYANRSRMKHDDYYEEMEIKVQEYSATWHMAMQLTHSIPAIFSDTLLGALGDRQGRKANILIGLAGNLCSVFPMIIIYTYKSAPLYILLISSLVGGFTGYTSIVMISCFAYLADTVVDQDMLTVRMTYFSVVMSVAGIFSPLIGSALMQVMSFAQTTLVTEGILVAAFFLTLLILRQCPPAVMKKKMLEKYIKEHGHPPPVRNARYGKYQNNEPANGNDPVKPDATLSGFQLIWHLFKDVYRTYARPRPGNARLYLLFASLVYFLEAAFEGGVRSSVFGLYVQKSPFHWGVQEIGTYRSVNAGLHLIGAVVGAVILKKLMKLSDTTIILIAMGSHAVECVLFALARTTSQLYVAAASGILVGMTKPCLKSFTAQLVDLDEVGKSYTAYGVAHNVASLISSVLYSSVYRATVGWYAGFVFLMAGGLQVLCMLLFLWLHMDFHYDGSVSKCFKDNICFRKIKGNPKLDGMENGINIEMR